MVNVTLDNIVLGKDCIIEELCILGKKGVKDVVAIGDNALIRAGTIIYPGVVIGKNFKTGMHAIIREKTEIGDDCLVGTNSVIDGDVTIGNNVRIQTGAYITCRTKIGNNVFIAPCVVTTNDKYPPSGKGADLEGPIIEDGVTIGAGAVLLPGVRIRANAVVGAGAVVTHDVQKNAVVIGNPAQFYKWRSEVYK